MSGIAGIVTPSPAARDRIRTMVASMAHRGPDGMHVDVGIDAALGNCAMHTTPEAVRERLPMRHAESGVVLTADARIDNREELISLLDLRRTDPTDADLLLHAYLKWGRSAPEHLVGDFAFAIWDPRDRTLFAARDHIGVRPFYYHVLGNSFYFGSEIKAIRVAAETRFDINEERVAEYIAKQVIGADATFFARIHRLPPAHSLTFTAGGTCTVQRYWSLDPDRETVYATDGEYEEAFREIFEEAVRCRMRANGDFAVMLSGGLDSSSVACVARDINQANGAGPVDTYTAQFGYDKADESEYLQALADQGGFRMHDVDLHGVDPLAEIESMIYHLDQPPIIGNLYTRMHCQRAVVADGQRALLDGSEGDITVSYGLGRLGEMVLAGNWGGLQYELQALATTTGASIPGIFRQNVVRYLPARLNRDPLQFLFRDLGHASRLHGSSRARLLYRTSRTLISTRFRSNRGSSLPKVQPLVAIDLARRSRLSERMADVSQAMSSDSFSDRLRHYMGINDEAGAISAVREDTNHIDALVGGESRHAFFDVRLVEHCVSLPSDQKLRDGYTRSIQRRSLSDTLPSQISRRMSKGNLSENFINQIRADSTGRIRDMLEEGRSTLQPYFDLQVLDQARANGNVMPLWTACTFLEWYQSVFMTAPAEPTLESISATSVEVPASY